LFINCGSSNQDSNLTSKNVGVVVSTFGSGTTLRLDLFSALNNGARRVSPRKTLNIGLDFPAAQIAAIYRVTGPNTSMDSACTTGITSIDAAVNQLKANPELDAMIVGGADHMAEPIYMYWFQNLGALSADGSRPFDRSRNGFVMGEGAAAMIIEAKDKALARGAKIYATIKSTSFITLFDSDTSPDPEGTGARLCVEQALSKAGIRANDIGYINAHATSTPVGDQIEFDVMKAITPDRVMVSNKGQLGHAMSTAGILETIYTVLALRDQRTPGNANLTDPCGQGMILPTSAININARYAVKNSFGFGGRNASIVLEQYVELNYNQTKYVSNIITIIDSLWLWYLGWGYDWIWWAVAIFFFSCYRMIGHSVGLHRYYCHKQFTTVNSVN
jgi:3-oxoacyl-[acyl-carrier-protein] synthase II